MLAFAFAMLEVSDSLILAQQTRYFPITKAIYRYSSAACAMVPTSHQHWACGQWHC